MARLKLIWIILLIRFGARRQFHCQKFSIVVPLSFSMFPSRLRSAECCLNNWRNGKFGVVVTKIYSREYIPSRETRRPLASNGMADHLITYIPIYSLHLSLIWENFEILNASVSESSNPLILRYFAVPSEETVMSIQFLHLFRSTVLFSKAENSRLDFAKENLLIAPDREQNGFRWMKANFVD